MKNKPGTSPPAIDNYTFEWKDPRDMSFYELLEDRKMSGSRSKKSGANRQPDSCKNARGGMLGRAICNYIY